MPRGIFGMRLVLVVKWSAESWFKRHSPLNAALGLTTKNVQGWRNGKVLSGSYFVGYIAPIRGVCSLA